jgi:hypothetical protein
MGHYTKRLTKVVGALKKASKAHAGQARTLKTILKDQKSYHGGKKTRPAKATIAKVKRLKKPYARKIQILTVMEQRAKVMGKTEVVRLCKQAKLQLKKQHNKKEK